MKTDSSEHPMNDAPKTTSPPPAAIRSIIALLRFILPVVVLVIAVIGAMYLLQSRPAATRTETEALATLVETIVASPSDQIAEITAYGTVEPHRELLLQPQVGGQVVRINEGLRSGGRIPAGEMLFMIDPRDYQIAMIQREADVAKAAVALQLEEARGDVAQREWELLRDSIKVSDQNEGLALRGPQKIEKEAALAAARGRLEKAELDLERTTISAPFNGIVLADDIEIGQVVSPQTRAATIAGTDRFDVMVSVPLDKLEWIRADPADPEGNSTARIIQELGNGRTVVRTGRVDRIVGEVERSGRLAKVRVLVEDPLGLEPSTDEARPALPLLLGSYVRVEIDGPSFTDAVELPRSVIRDNGNIWIFDRDGRLQIRPSTVIAGRPDTVLVESFLLPGEEVVSSPLPAALPGMLLERIGSAGRPGSNPEVNDAEVDRGEA